MLSVSAIKSNKAALTWLAISVFCAVFALIYEYFSFRVYSPSMIFLFAWPLCLGVLPALFTKHMTGRLWNDGVLLLTAGSLLTGIFEIYGTTSTMTHWFYILGAACLLIGGISAMIHRPQSQ